MDLSRKLLAKLLREPLRALDKSIEVDPRLVSHPVQEVHQVLCCDVAGRLRGEGAAARTSHRRVEHCRPRLDGRRRVCHPRVAGVMEVATYGGPEPEDTLDEGSDLIWHADAYGVREYDLVWLRHSYPLGQIAHDLRLYSSLERAPEGGGEGNRNPYSVQSRPLDEPLGQSCTFLHGRVLVLLCERLRHREGVAHLVRPGLDRPLVASLIQRQARIGGVRVAVYPGHHLFGAGHLRHELGVDEARRLYPRNARGGQPVAQLGPGLRGERLVLVLQAVARAHVYNLYPHRLTPVSRSTHSQPRTPWSLILLRKPR